MLKPVELHVENSRVTWNTLYDTTDPRYLTQDLLLVELPSGMFIDVSWFPEHDAQGEYHITLCRDNWESQVNQWKTRSVSDVVSLVEGLAKQHSQQYVATPSGPAVLLNMLPQANQFWGLAAASLGGIITQVAMQGRC
jgi:hypothetical protein